VRSGQSGAGLRRAAGPRGGRAARRNEPPALHAGRRLGALPAIAFQWADAIPDHWLAERLDVAFGWSATSGRGGRRCRRAWRRWRPVFDNAECGIALEVRSLHDAHLDIPHSALRIPHSRGAGVGMVRIIAGEFKGRRLKTPSTGQGAADRRPRARSVVLHPPAAAAWGARPRSVRGSGALGLEGLSRCAVSADFVEIHRLALSSLKANITLPRWMTGPWSTAWTRSVSRTASTPGSTTWRSRTRRTRVGTRRDSSPVPGNPFAHHLDRASSGSADSRRRHAALRGYRRDVHLRAMTAPGNRVAVYPGSFDPITRGHETSSAAPGPSPTA